MIEVSAVQFIQNPAHIQALATKEPVIVDNGKHKQVLMNYDDYQALTKKMDADKPSLSAYDAYMQIMSDYSDEELEALADDSVEFDMSFLEQK